MRVTKARLLAMIATATNFRRLPFRAVTPSDEHRLRNDGRFVPAKHYGLGMSLAMDRHEIGCLGNIRYRLKSRRGDGK